MLHPAILAVLSPEGLAFLQESGIESTSDLAFFFTSQEDIFDAIADQALVQNITHAWKIARIRADQELQAQQTKRCRFESPKLPIAVAAQGLRPKARSRPPAALLPKPFRAEYAAKPLRVAPALQDKKVALIRVVLEVVVACASENLVLGREVWGNPGDTFDLFAARFRNVTEERLKAHISTLKRWIKWHATHVPAEVVYWKPSPVWLARFLAHVSQGALPRLPTSLRLASGGVRSWACLCRLKMDWLRHGLHL